MSNRFANSALQCALVSMLLLTPPTSDAVEQRSITPDQDNRNDVIQIVSESWRKGTIDAAFLLNKNIESSSVNVSVTKNTATLSGFTNSEIKKNLASEIALSVEGIDHVINKLKVNHKSTEISNTRAPEQNPQDRLLTARVNHTLLENKYLQRTRISVHATDGVIELSGSISNDSLKDLAYYLAKNVTGVRSVDNKMTVR